MIHLFLVLDLVDHRLTQAAMRKLALLSNRRIGKPDLNLREKNQLGLRHVTANPFSYRGLCDPGDLNHQCLN